MTEKTLKIIFYLLAISMLLAMLLISRDAGISADEEVHYKQSEMVFNYFKTFGQDQSSINTPKTHLQYYGQAFDNLVTILIHWFGIDDIYGFRHLMCSLAGWTTILVTALFAASMAGYGAAILVLLLFAASPTFLGHAQNNLKDIPFALAYISGIYFSLKFVFADNGHKRKTILLLILSIGLAIGIRAGGILLVFYLAFFILIKATKDWFEGKNIDPILLKKQLTLFAVIAVSGFLLGLALWPFALRNPILNTWKSYLVMTHFPTTVRQIFEGSFIWSDFHPWYYLPKYMAITIPLVVFSGVVLFFVNAKKNFSENHQIQLILLGYTIVFPIIFVILKNSNLYGSWRHFLFLYPGILLFSALGIHAFLIRYKHWFVRLTTVVFFTILMVHPLKFMATNHPYYYLYYNQLVGGLKGAYGNYETDYYYNSIREGAEWLQEYLKDKPQIGEVVVGCNLSAKWYFRNDTTIEFVYFPWQKRSGFNWDYAIVVNSYISPFQLKNGIWPPANSIHTIYADGVPVCAVVERLTKDDFYGIQEQKQGNLRESGLLLKKALQVDPQNELINYKFAEVLLAANQPDSAKQALNRCLEINPDYEPAIILAGDLAVGQNNKNEAVRLYERAIMANRKYYSAYTRLAGIYAETDVVKSRKILKECLKMNRRYKPALIQLAESYRKTDPLKAEKIDIIISTIE